MRLAAINHEPKRTIKPLFEHKMNFYERLRTSRTNSGPWHHSFYRESLKLGEMRLEAFCCMEFNICVATSKRLFRGCYENSNCKRD